MVMRSMRPSSRRGAAVQCGEVISVMMMGPSLLSGHNQHKTTHTHTHRKEVLVAGSGSFFPGSFQSRSGVRQPAVQLMSVDAGCACAAGACVAPRQGMGGDATVVSDRGRGRDPEGVKGSAALREAGRSGSSMVSGKWRQPEPVRCPSVCPSPGWLGDIIIIIRGEE